jgi:hypothetical protein
MHNINRINKKKKEPKKKNCGDYFFFLKTGHFYFGRIRTFLLWLDNGRKRICIQIRFYV